jgi:hypothetical protein
MHPASALPSNAQFRAENSCALGLLEMVAVDPQPRLVCGRARISCSSTRA